MPYPTAVDTFYEPRNNWSTTLSAPITNSALTIPLVSTTGLPSEGLLTINDSEIVKYTAIVGLNLTIDPAGRGYDGTTATTHAAGAKVSRNMTAHDLNSLQDSVVELEKVVGLKEVAALNNNQLAAIDVGTIFVMDGTYREMHIDYLIQREVSPGTSMYESGRLSIIRYSGTQASVATLFSHQIDSAGGNTSAGVTFSASVSGGTTRLKYVSTNVVNTTSLTFTGTIVKVLD